jgi:dihydroorotase
VAEVAVAGQAAEVGRPIARLEIERAWLVDPLTDREGPARISVRDGLIEAVSWLSADDGAGLTPNGVLVAPGFIDLHAHLREPGFEDAETVASGLAAAAHGGFTTVCAMPNTEPPVDESGVLGRVLAAAEAARSPVELLAYGALTAGRGGATLAALGELSDAGAIGFSDDGAPVRSSTILGNGLLYAGMLGRLVVDHAEDSELTAGAEANEGLVATILGLKGWPGAAESGPVGRDLAILAGVLRDEPRARLHLTHLSTAAALELVRRAKAVGLPVTCDVTPHHLALTDAWIGGVRSWAWQTGPVWPAAPRDANPYDPALRVNPPLRDALDAAACRTAIVDGTADAIATDHAPHSQVDKAVEFGLAANGISGIETAIGIVLAAVDADQLSLGRAISALTSGPAAILAATGWTGSRGFAVGSPANLVVIDRSAPWLVRADNLLSKGKNSPLIGRELPATVVLTIAAGRLAYRDPGRSPSLELA